MIPIKSIRRKLDTTGESGQSIIESAIAFPVLFMLLFAFIEVCFAFYTQDMISESAREGTEYAMFHSSTCATFIAGVPDAAGTCTATTAQVQSYIQGLGWPNIAGGTMATPTVTYLTPAGASGGTNIPGDEVQIKVTYTMPITIPFLPHAPLTMSSTSTMTIMR
jgi:Flp pilus assembly protein TadG